MMSERDFPGMDDHANTPSVPQARPITVDVEPTVMADRVCSQALAPFPPAIPFRRALLELFSPLLFGWLGLFATLFLVIGLVQPTDDRWVNIIGSGGMGLGAVFGCVLVLLLTRQKPASVGLVLRRPIHDVGIGLSALTLFYLLIFSITFALMIWFPEMIPAESQAQKAIEQSFPRLSFPIMIGLTLFVAFWEEFVFRGFVLTRLRALTGRWWAAILLSSLLFGSIHFYQGGLAVLIIGGSALMMAMLFVWRQSLLPSFVFHFGHNLIMFSLLDNVSTSWQ